MSVSKKHIFVTRSLTPSQIDYARKLGLEPIIRNALEFRFPDDWGPVLEKVRAYPGADWAFTSRNGVYALKQLIQQGLRVPFETQAYAVGARTRKELEETGLQAAIPDVWDGKHLAERILQDNRGRPVVHFCGNLSRKELAEGLAGGGVEAHPVEVYKTIIHSVALPEASVEAILFFSPSAVEGFCRGQGFSGELPRLFAIGHTTAGALHSKTDQDIEVAEEPDTERILQAVADNLHHHPI